jgi:hypothetical protein
LILSWSGNGSSSPLFPGMSLATVEPFPHRSVVRRVAAHIPCCHVQFSYIIGVVVVVLAIVSLLGPC